MANRRIEIVTPGILMTIIERLCNSLTYDVYRDSVAAVVASQIRCLKSVQEMVCTATFAHIIYPILRLHASIGFDETFDFHILSNPRSID